MAFFFCVLTHIGGAYECARIRDARCWCAFPTPRFSRVNLEITKTDMHHFEKWQLKTILYGKTGCQKQGYFVYQLFFFCAIFHSVAVKTML